MSTSSQQRGGYLTLDFVRTKSLTKSAMYFDDFALNRVKSAEDYTMQ